MILSIVPEVAELERIGSRQNSRAALGNHRRNSSACLRWKDGTSSDERQISLAVCSRWNSPALWTNITLGRGKPFHQASHRYGIWGKTICKIPNSILSNTKSILSLTVLSGNICHLPDTVLSYAGRFWNLALYDASLKFIMSLFVLPQ